MQDFIISVFQYIINVILMPILIVAEFFYELIELLTCKKQKNPEYVLITGATSGIGLELAKKYGAMGAKLILLSRSQEKLEKIKVELEALRCNVDIHSVDVVDKAKMREIITSYEHLDIVIANAGVSQGLAGVKDNENILEQTYNNILNINVNGVFNTVFPAVDVMKKQGYGTICLISSIAGLGQNALYPAYGTSKIAVNAFGQGLRNELEPYNIHVNIVCPGIFYGFAGF